MIHLGNTKNRFRQKLHRGNRSKGSGGKLKSIYKLLAVCMIGAGAFFILIAGGLVSPGLPALQSKSTTPIKWVDFDVPYEALNKAMKIDIQTYNTEVHCDWVELLAYLGTTYGGDFRQYKARDMDQLADKLQNGETMEALTANMKHYSYYLESYQAILGGFLGTYKTEVPTQNAEGASGGADPGADQTAQPKTETSQWASKYGLKAFSPIADGYWYNDYDDFGAGRSYGYDRKHFGHDLMIETGTPIVAIESGIVEATGWNQYGGWRIGIRSYDQHRYYYYAHLRKDRPYAAGLYVGKAVKAGDVIGYSGRTGYSIKENVNNIDQPHLHVGMQLIFDEDQKDSPNQIWVDLYSITRLLSQNKSPVYKDENKEYHRKYNFSEDNFYQLQEKEKPDTKRTTDSGMILANDPGSPVPDDQSAIATAAMNASEAPEDSIPVPILMYHGLLKDPALQNKFVIDPKLFETDLKYLQEHGYTTVFMQDLIDYVHKDKPLPEKPIVLSFDDGYYNNYLYAYPLLKQYNSKIVLSIIGKYTDEFSETEDNHATYSHVTWNQLNEMIASGNLEIGNHTYNLHTSDKGRQGSKQKPGESVEAYQSLMDNDVGKLQQRIQEQTGYTPTTFAYPFGYMSNGSRDILKGLGFQATLSCSEGINYLTKDPKYLFQMKRILRPPYTSSEEFFKKHGIL